MSDDRIDIPWKQTYIGSFVYTPDDATFWWIIKRWSGWYWHTSRMLPGGTHDRTSSEAGPFSNVEAAKADCEVAHR